MVSNYRPGLQKHGQQVKNLGSTRHTASLIQWLHCSQDTPDPLAQKLSPLPSGSCPSGLSFDSFFLLPNFEPSSDGKTFHVSCYLQPYANSVVSFCHNYWFAGLSLQQDSELIEAKDYVLFISVKIQRCRSRTKCFSNVLFTMDERVSEWMSEGVRHNPMRSSETPKAFASLTGNETEHQTQLLKTTHCSFPYHHCLGSGALARNQEKKNVDVCLQGYMCGLISDVFQQILRPWTKPKGYRFKMDFLQPTSGEECWGSLKASPLHAIKSFPEAIPLALTQPHRLEWNLIWKTTAVPLEAEDESEGREGTDFSDFGHSKFLLESYAFSLDMHSWNHRLHEREGLREGYVIHPTHQLPGFRQEIKISPGIHTE